jgi:hypothetical protein
MSTTVCLEANSLGYPSGGSYLWVYLNWVLGLQANGSRVVWLESCAPGIAAEKLQGQVASLRSHLAEFGLADSRALYFQTGEPLTAEVVDGFLDLRAYGRGGDSRHRGDRWQLRPTLPLGTGGSS